MPGDLGARKTIPWTRDFERQLLHCRGVVQILKKRPDIQPDLVVGHSGLGSALFIPEVTDCPIVNYFEYFMNPWQNDMLYRKDFDHPDSYFFWRRSANAMFLLDLENCRAAIHQPSGSGGCCPRNIGRKCRYFLTGRKWRYFGHFEKGRVK